MKLKYGIHAADENGQPTLPRIAKIAEVEKSGDFYPAKELAQICLLEGIRLGSLKGTYADYVIQPYDEQGNMVQAVEDSDRDAAAADAKYLIEKHHDIKMGVSSLLASRQMYAASLSELQRLLEQKIVIDDKGDAHPAHKLTIEILIQASAVQAQKPFNEVDLFEGLTHTVLPWLQKTIESHAKLEIADQQKRTADDDKARRESLVPIGISLNPGDPPTLSREQGLVLVGYWPAVKFLLYHAVNTVLTATDPDHPNRVMSLIHLRDDDTVKPSNNERLVMVGRKYWSLAAKNKKALARMVHDNVLPQAKYAPDLLVIDDLAAAADGILTSVGGTGGAFRGGLAPFRAAEAFKKLMDWCKYAGMGLLAGIPANDERPVDLTSTEWERLRTHSVLRFVSVIRKADDLDPDKVRILVGRDSYKVDVDPAILEPVNKIIT